MNKEPISYLKNLVKGKYSGYRFEVKAIQSTQSYALTVFRQSDNLGTLSLAANMPRNLVWDEIKDYMRRVIN